MSDMTNMNLIGATEVAAMLGLTRNAVIKRVNTGKLNPMGRIGKSKTLVFDRAEVEALAEKEHAK